MCAELADLGMQLARAAAARSLATSTESEDPPMPAPQPNDPAELHAGPAPAATSRRAAGQAGTAAPCKRTDPALLFARLAAVVRDCVALEARLAAAPAAPTHAASRTLRADPRRALLHEAFRDATEKHADRAYLRRETNTRLDQELGADAGQTVHPGHIFFTICDELGIEIDVARLPDELLYSDAETAYPGNDPHGASDPRATYPP